MIIGNKNNSIQKKSYLQNENNGSVLTTPCVSFFISGNYHSNKHTHKHTHTDENKIFSKQDTITSGNSLPVQLPDS
jgi:hypothetical protein